MIEVKIYVPSVSVSMCTSLDEYTDISYLIKILGISVTEGYMKAGDKEFFLASQNHHKFLAPEKNLAFYNIQSGDRLLLI